MSPEKEQMFVDRWPQWFPRLGCICVGDGWFELLWELFWMIDAIGWDSEMEVGPIEEEFGGLRVCVSFASENAMDLVYLAESDSFHVCGHCGSGDGVATKGSWSKTLCKQCRKQ